MYSQNTRQLLKLAFKVSPQGYSNVLNPGQALSSFDVVSLGTQFAAMLMSITVLSRTLFQDNVSTESQAVCCGMVEKLMNWKSFGRRCS
jgi:hypothetical protein